MKKIRNWNKKQKITGLVLGTGWTVLAVHNNNVAKAQAYERYSAFKQMERNAAKIDTKREAKRKAETSLKAVKTCYTLISEAKQAVSEYQKDAMNDSKKIAAENAVAKLKDNKDKAVVTTLTNQVSESTKQTDTAKAVASAKSRGSNNSSSTNKSSGSGSNSNSNSNSSSQYWTQSNGSTSNANSSSNTGGGSNSSSNQASAGSSNYITLQHL